MTGRYASAEPSYFQLLSVLLEPFMELLRRWNVQHSQQTLERERRSTAEVTDEWLVAQWRQGDSQAFEAIVKKYQHVAVSVCTRYLGTREAGEDTAQEVFVTLFRKLADFRGESSFRTWFFKVLVNHCRNRHKSLVVRKQHLHSSIDEPYNDEARGSPKKELADDNPGPEHQLISAERQRIIEKALASLPEDARAVLLLREGQGMSYDEIAVVLQMAVGTVKSRIHRARAELKSVVEAVSGS